MHIALCSGTYFRVRLRVVVSFLFLFLVSFCSIDFGIYLYGFIQVPYSTLLYMHSVEIPTLFLEHFNLYIKKAQ